MARNLGARLRRSGGEWVGPCPVCGGKDRFAINPSKGLWNCRGCGRGGDAIDLVRRVTGGSFRSAVAVVDGESRPDHSCDVCSTQRVAKQATAPAAPPRADRRGLALWRKAAPIDRTPADLYLGARGFAPPYPATLGYLPGRGGHPHALISALGLPNEPEPGLLRIQDAAVRAVHHTRLDPIGTKRLKTDDAKIIVGQGELGFPVALTPVNDGLGLLIVEGIENALSLGLSTGLGAWAACGHTRMPALASAVPSYVEAVTIVADPEPEARASACALADRLERRGFDVTVIVMGEAV